MVLVGSIAVASAARANDEPYVGFSLREAARRGEATEDAELHDGALSTLAGMTRIVGMVYTRDGDIVLIGRRVVGQPGITLDDLCIALRARIVHGEWPFVSIDPDDETHLDGLQRVTYSNGLENGWGVELLASDVILKTYAMQLSPEIDGIPSYRSLATQQMLEECRAKGIRATRICWMAPDAVQADFATYHQRAVDSMSVRCTKFWFTAQQPYRFVARDGVFCIRELHLQVEAEDVICGANAEDAAARAFCSTLSERMPALMAAHAQLKRLKVIFDLIAVAEGVKQLSDGPDLTYFLESHHVQTVTTADTHELVRLSGVVDRDDGVTHLVQLSGGVELRADIEWLNDGDVAPLGDIVVRARPAPTSLWWRLPLDTWVMPNAHDLAMQGEPPTHRRPRASDRGSTLYTQSVVLGHGPPAPGSGRPAFHGLHAAPPVSALSAWSDPRLGGVSLQMLIPAEAIRPDESGELDRLERDILRNRKGLSWPAGRKNGGS
jgi:hypothetical protein